MSDKIDEALEALNTIEALEVHGHGDVYRPMHIYADEFRKIRAALERQRELVVALERLCDFNPPPARCEEHGDHLRAEAIRNAETLLAKIYGDSQ